MLLADEWIQYEIIDAAFRRDVPSVTDIQIELTGALF